MSESAYLDFMAKHPLSVMVNQTNAMITQCPLVYVHSRHSLIGHLAIGNEFLSTTSDGDSVTLLFSGNQGYISPNWYDEKARAQGSENINFREVPTWNYNSLEVIGKLNLVSSDQTLKVLTKQTQFLESRVNENWTLDKLSESAKSAMIKAITAFEINIESWQGKEKLSQNKSTLLKSSLINHMKNQNNVSYDSLVADMLNKMNDYEHN